MITTNEVELLEKSSVKLKITIPLDEIKKEYDDLVKNYCKTIQVKGFRKGKVPPNVLITKFGDSLKDETAQKVINKSLEETLEKVELKPLPYSQPTFLNEDDMKFELDKDFIYELSYDTFPKVELGEYTGLEVEEPEVEITDEDMDRELKQLQEQNALVVEKKDGVVEKDSIIKINYAELDDNGKVKEDTKREDFTFTVGTGYNLYEIDDEVTGMKKSEEKIIEKSYPEDYKFKDLAGKTIKIQVKVTDVKVKDLPELDDELAQDISDKYENLDDLKSDIRKKMEESAEMKIKEDKISQLIEQVVKASKMDLPESMVQQELQMKWSNMLRQMGGNEQLLLMQLQAENKTKEEFMEAWIPSAEEGIKSGLVVEEMANKEKIEIAPEEIDAEIEKLAESRNVPPEDMKSQLSTSGMLESLNFNIRNQKLFTHLLKSTTIKKGKKFKYLDYIQGKTKDE